MTVTSPYNVSRHNHRSVEPELPNPSTEYPTLLDVDGLTLCEQQLYRLRTAIMELNDTIMLEKYLLSAPWALKRGHTLGMYYDPFIVAARHGSRNALKMLLNHHSSFLMPIERTDLDGRCCRVLNEAAHCGHLEVVKCLLDHPPFQADIHVNNNVLTPIIVAAELSYCKGNLQEKEAVINLLPDRGARASDAEYIMGYCLDTITGEGTQKQMPILMALNFAAEWAGADLIRRRLIENGADPHQADGG